MSNDDDPTPPRGSPRLWGDTRRSSSAAERRRREDDARERRATEPITDTVLLVDREEMSGAEIEVVRRSRRGSDDPATFADIVKLAVANARRDGAGDGELRAEVVALRRDMKIVSRVGGVLLTIVLGTAAWAISLIWTSGEQVGKNTIRVQHLEDADIRFYQELRDIRSRKDTP